MKQLRDRNPGLFQAPSFWPVDLESINRQLQASRAGEPFRAGTSSGGRPISGIAYGAFEPQTPTATISSAMASDRPAAFYDPSKRTRPVLVIIGSIHGGETEGTALCMNLVNLMETATDLRGKRHDKLRETLQQVRLILIPCLNPDGRHTACVAHLNQATVEELFLVQQGVCANGSLFRGRKVKETAPIPKGFLQHMGGYYNADGVNLQHDDFFGPGLAPENLAIQSVFRKEIPDAFLVLHAHGAPAAFITPDAYLSPGYQRKQIEAAGFILSRLVERKIPILTPEQLAVPPWSFYFQTWLHHMSGALPLLFEFSHGLKETPCSLEEIVDTGLLVTQAWAEYCLTFHARPGANELFGRVTPTR